MLILPPTSLYIHMPWCIKKCPYCDFNSHEARSNQLPEDQYINALLRDLELDIERYGSRQLHSIFIGGGTPSLFSGRSYQRLLRGIQALTPFESSIEISLEANPHSSEYDQFMAYLDAGINRVSLGIQSFNDATLERIGRLHRREHALQAILAAQQAGFQRINLDIMYACPSQNPDSALRDLQQACETQATHVSWYQFTLEPNTYFYKFPPPLPHDDMIEQMEHQGLELLAQHDFQRYEISAFQKNQQASHHNLNYWRFGDYFGIGAGAHGKITLPGPTQVMRTQKHRMPQTYLQAMDPCCESKSLTQEDLIFEFMLNALRLEEPMSLSCFEQRTGLPKTTIQPKLAHALDQGWINLTQDVFQITSLGRNFTNDVQALFLA